MTERLATAIATAVVIAVLLAVGFLIGYQWEAGNLAKAEENWAKERETLANAQTRASETARAEEQRVGTDIHAAATTHLKEKNDAQTRERRVIADLRADTLRLRNQWAGCETRRVSETAARAAESDDTARLRIESAGRIVRAAAECDAHVRGLQQTLEAERGHH